MIESKLFHIVKYIMIGVAILELALSQVHIEAITLMFIREIGFFLFLFIFASLIMIAILTSFNEWSTSNALTTLLAGLAAGGSGLYTIFLILNARQSARAVPFENISTSFILLVVGVSVFLIGTVILLITAQRDHKGEIHGKKTI
ncbi:hypothetical protein LZ578_00450 [Jeotgalibaca sp. MA1X17-3]|uniref:hypothetical protein n=1 Tax=Jeotgalibaca sp. MA1X17-3 TaxID=2908211 RepID=UPI001F2E6C41|nr:hypothetical protein [Jeotgalibaca sp. MA1X17-3]UJF15716.1 hypothetical protein LZ578_00450 [Jeotgalibaca sp. MA1X17-3]